MITDRLAGIFAQTTTATRTPGSAGGSTSIDQIKAGDGLPEPSDWLVIRVNAAFTRAAGAIDTVFELQTHTADDFTADRTVLWRSGTIAKATLVAGYTLRVPLPPGALRYLAVVTKNTNAADAGSIDWFITPAVQLNDL